MTFQAKPILVPIDFSENSGIAIETALKFAAAEDVHLVHVLYPLDSMSPGVVWGSVTDESREEAVQESFDEFQKKFGCEAANTTVRFGHPAEEVVELAEEIKAELIVVPSHGYHGMKRFVLGSVAEKIVRHAPCPTFVLPCRKPTT